MWLMTPEVMCLIPGVDLPMEEHECCKRMGGECDMVPMSDIHKCCKAANPSDMVITAKATDYPQLRVALHSRLGGVLSDRILPIRDRSAE